MSGSDRRKLNQLLATANAVATKYHCFAMQLSVTRDSRDGMLGSNEKRIVFERLHLTERILLFLV